MVTDDRQARMKRWYDALRARAHRAEAAGWILESDGRRLCRDGTVTAHYADGAVGMDEGESDEEMEQRRAEYARRAGNPT